ncbi:MAG: hypothetical protein CMP28_14700 [Roseibacillus sp.]|nr:hypothetical protein [Roseibacillus sp.]
MCSDLSIVFPDGLAHGAESLMWCVARGVLPGPAAFWGEDVPFLMGEAILLGAMGYYLVAWLLVGVDGQKAAGVPKQEPPAGYSPAALRYLWSIEDCPIGVDDGAFTTAVVGLAAKGVVAIEQNGSTFHLHDLGLGSLELLPDEAVVYHALFNAPASRGDMARESLTLGSSAPRDKCDAAIAGLHAHLHASLKRGRGYQAKNRVWVWIGVLISLLGAGFLNMDPAVLEGRTATDGVESSGEIASGLDVQWVGRVVAGVGLALLWALVIFLLHGSFVMLRRRDMEPGLGLGGIGLVFAGLLVKMTLEIYTGAGFLRIAAWMLCGYALNARGMHLLKRFSARGRMVQDHIEGLQIYMQEGRKGASARGMNLEHHDQLLPYAVALGRARQWSGQFKEVLAQRQDAGTPSAGFRGDLEGPGVGSALAVNGKFHEALMASCSPPPPGGWN